MADNLPKFRFPAISFLPIILTIIFGYFFTQFMEKYAVNNECRDLLARTATAAAALDAESVALLTGTTNDLETRYYEEILRQLVKIQRTDKDIRFVYVMGLKDNKVVFLLDTEEPASKDYSAPGDIYESASAELQNVFHNGTMLVEGPLKDSWGTWVSGIAPIFDPQTGNVIAILGMDIDARLWNERISVYRQFSIVITGLVVLIVLTYLVGLYHLNAVRKKLRSEIVQRKSIEKDLVNLAITDHLTGVNNRRHFFDEAQKELSRSTRYARPIVFLMIDIDYFKKINDRFGHAVGDDVLKAMAVKCIASFRKTDIFGRVGGEEFAAVLVELGPKKAFDVADRLRKDLSNLVINTESEPVTFTVSIGLTTVTTNDASLEEIIKRTDKALYEAKRRGRNCVVEVA